MGAGTYIAVDLETTGLSPKKDGITEIAAIKIVDGRMQGRFSCLVNPGRPIGGEVIRLTGITNEMVAGAPTPGDLIGEVLEFFSGLPLLGHNIRFDYMFLKRAAVNAGLPFEYRCIDTLKLCRAFMPGGMRMGLNAACAYYGIRNRQAHRAYSDALACHELYQALYRQGYALRPELFEPFAIDAKVKRDPPASVRQKEYLQELIKYHKIEKVPGLEGLTRSEVSRLTDKIILAYGRRTGRDAGRRGF